MHLAGAHAVPGHGVDLVHRPTDPQPVYPRMGGSYQTRWLAVDEHTGTHADAPRHFIPPPGSGLPHAGPAGEIGIDRLPLLAAVGPADVVDVTSVPPAQPGRSPAIGTAELDSWEAAHGSVRPGDVVLLHSGWDERYRRGPAGAGYGSQVLAGTEPGWPAPTPEAMGWLHERGVRCVGNRRNERVGMAGARQAGRHHVAAAPLPGCQ